MIDQPERHSSLRRHAMLLPLMRAIIDDAVCDCEDSYGASAEAIARVCVMLGDELYHLEDPRNADYFDVLTCDEDDDLASFIGAILFEAFSLLPRPNDEDRGKFFAMCDVNARRIVSDPEYAHLLRRRYKPVLRVIEGGRRNEE
jgi:hypothetical protein